MNFLPKNFEEKPYDRCLSCAYIGKQCDGPNFLAMDMPRLCEWCRLRKEYLHRKDAKWTNAFIAEESGLSKVSIDRFLSGNVEDIKMSTVSRILKILINGTWGQYPCSMAAGSEAETVYVDNPALVEKAENAITQCKKLQATLDNLNAEHKENLAAARAEDKANIDYLKERVDYLKGQISFKEEQMASKDRIIQDRYDFMKRKDHIIRWLAVLWGITVLVIIALIVVDVLDPNHGFFWLADGLNLI